MLNSIQHTPYPLRFGIKHESESEKPDLPDKKTPPLPLNPPPSDNNDEEIPTLFENRKPMHLLKVAIVAILVLLGWNTLEPSTKYTQATNTQNESIDCPTVKKHPEKFDSDVINKCE